MVFSMSCDGDFFGHAMWLQQCLQLLPDGLHLESLLHDFQVFVAAIQILLRGTYVLSEILCQAENCTHNILGAISCQPSNSDHHFVLLVSSAHQYLDQIRHMRMITASTAGAFAPLRAVALLFLLSVCWVDKKLLCLRGQIDTCRS